MKVLVIEPDSTMRAEDVPSGFPALNDALFDGGLMQVLYGREKESGDRVAFLLDEEGKYKGLEPNMAAFLAWEAFFCDGAHLMQGDMLAGRVAICGLSGESFTDVPESVWPKNLKEARP